MGYSFAHTAGHTLPLAERWNGQAWAIQPTPTLPTAVRTFLDGISCTTASSYIAVGFAVTTNAPYTVALAEAWNGNRWVIQAATPDPGSGGASFEAISPFASLNGITCSSAAQCVAVGRFSTKTASVTLVERYSG